MNIKLLNGNVMDMLKTITDESVDCIVSSPPYYGLRDYSGVATYSSEDYDDLLVIANTDLQEHRDRASESQKDRYYLTDPAFNEKDNKWYVSLKYDTSGVWGGDTECDHEWISQQNHKDNLRFRDPNNVASVGNNKNAEIFADPTVLSGNCSKCGAWKGQLGLEPTYQMYIDHLMLVMRELKRVLKKTGALFWNMGDSYAGDMGSRAGWQDSKYSESREEGINNGEAVVFLKADYGNIQAKSLMMIPERFAMAMIDDGWVLRNKIVWYKPNGMPSSVKDRLSNKWEYVFFFTKSQKYYFDLDSVRKPLKESSIQRRNYPTNTINWETRHKDSGIRALLETGSSNSTKRTKHDEAVQRYGSYDDPLYTHPNHSNGANPGDVNADESLYDLFADPNMQSAFFEYLERERPDLLMSSILDIPTRAHSFAHFAVFPQTLVEPLIKAGCPSEVCVNCGKPKAMQYKREEYLGNEKPLSGKHIMNESVNSPGNREHYFTNVRKYDVDQKEIALFIKKYITDDKLPLLDSKFGETRWKHWIRTDDSGGALPSPSEYRELKDLLNLPNDHDYEMLNTVKILVDDSGSKDIPIGFKPSCKCNADFEPGTVLDPFAGSGTVGVVAMKQEKNAILIEISPEYCNIIKKRLNWGVGLDVEYEHVVGEALK